MNRETRRANLKKLQLPGTATGNLRKTRSATTVSSSISTYFSASPKEVTTSQTANIVEETPNNGASAPAPPVTEQPNDNLQPEVNQNETPTANSAQPVKSKRFKRTKLTAFVFKDNQNVPNQFKAAKQLAVDDFETPEKKVKKAPILRRCKPTTKVEKSRTSKRQPSVKSAFLRNEQLFSEITAQHCVAEQFSADEVQLALAISKSEAETSGILCADVDEELVVDLVNDEMYKDGAKSGESVRNKLQKYGFRTAVHEDYNCLAAAFLPGVNRRLKTKWANKFTALTLRNPELQKKKVNGKIDAFLQQQFRAKSLSAAEQQIKEYRFLSGTLRLYREQQSERRVLKDENALLALPLDDYFVQELFEVTDLRAGHLLKDWRAIQGRDLSPGANSRHCKASEAQFQTVYNELEDHFIRKQSNAGASEEYEILFEKNVEGLKERNMINDNNIELEKLVGILEESSQNQSENAVTLNLITPAIVNSPSREPPDKRLKVDSQDKIESFPQNMRAVSPDIFADSDKEMDETTDTHRKADYKTEIGIMDVTQSKHGITTYELYSSEEVKTYSYKKQFSEAAYKEKENPNTDNIDDIIDLTQNEDESLQASVEKNLSQDSEILAAIQAYGSEKQTFAVQNSTYRTPSPLRLDKVGDVEENRLYGKYVVPLEVQKPQSSTSIRLPNKTQTSKNTVRGGFMQQHNWQTFEQSISQTSLKRSQSTSFTSTAHQFDSLEKRIDLTQSDLSDENGDDDCIVLSDDEINYSIRKANKSITTKRSEDKTLQPQKNENNDTREPQWNAHNFSVLDFLDNETSFSPSKKSTSNASSDSVDIVPPVGSLISEPNGSDMQLTSKALDRSRERAEFGILENISETLTQTSPWLQTPTKADNENLLLTSPSENAMYMKRFSNDSAQKFNTLVQNVQHTELETRADSFTINDEFDEFDRLIYGSPKHKLNSNQSKIPAGLEQLLTAEISFRNEVMDRSITENVIPNEAANHTVCTPTKNSSDVHTEYHFAGRSYKVRVVNTPKPDFTQQTEAELLKQLYQYGIKPLKRKQAVKMLEYIYNQTHPIMLEKEAEEAEDKLKDKYEKQKLGNHANIKRSQSENQPTKIIDTQTTAQIDKIQLRDCSGDLLLRYAHELNAELMNEEYIFQTNISKKLSQALLPLHIAWYNLVCANPLLHETILLFEPIDLQQIYLFFKQLGYRYEPKDLKRFFDQRCIIFRYDLTPPGKQGERHIRKACSKKSSKGLGKTKSLQN